MERKEIERSIKTLEKRFGIAVYNDDNEMVDALEVAILLLRAELSRQENAPLTLNERINQMTVEEKVELFTGRLLEVYAESLAMVWNSPVAPARTPRDAIIDWLNSPYTE